MSKTLDLACALIARRSLTPDDAGCQELLIERLQPLGFRDHYFRKIEIYSRVPDREGKRLMAEGLLRQKIEAT